MFLNAATSLDTGYKMYKDIPKELHDLRKAQMNKLKKARQEGKRAHFSKSEPDKLYIVMANMLNCKTFCSTMFDCTINACYYILMGVL